MDYKLQKQKIEVHTDMVKWAAVKRQEQEILLFSKFENIQTMPS